MKKKNKLHNLVTKALGLALVFCMALSFCAPLHVEAKKIKTLKLNPDDSSSTVEHLESVATTVKKGTYKIKIKTTPGAGMCGGCIKFVAPKTKTYTITLSDLKTNNKIGSCGSVSFYSPDSKNEYTGLRYDVIVNGKKDHKLSVHTERKTIASYAYKRTGKLHLNEGEVLYLHFQFAAERPTKYVTAKFKIK